MDFGACGDVQFFKTSCSSSRISLRRALRSFAALHEALNHLFRLFALGLPLF